LNAEELPSYHRNIDMDKVMLAHADGDPVGRRSGDFSFTPQGVLHGADEASRAEIQTRRAPGMRRTRIGVGVDTYWPLNVYPEFARMTGDPSPIPRAWAAGAYFSGGNETFQNTRARAAAFVWRNRSCATACFSSATWSARSIEPCVGKTQAVGQRVIPLVRTNSAITAS
jgi:hypothetical protein